LPFVLSVSIAAIVAASLLDERHLHTGDVAEHTIVLSMACTRCERYDGMVCKL
jgi:hypothetical protein